MTLTLPEIQMLTVCRPPVDPRRYRAWWSTFSRAHADAWARADRTVEPDLLNGRIRFRPTSRTIPDVAALHKRRRNRRDRSKRRLLGEVDDAVGGSDDALTLPHVVYLVHIPAENTLKVGIGCNLTASTRSICEQWMATLVDQVVVANRHFALIIEADVLDLVEEWHQLGDMGNPAGGFPEMWSADGPTVDLHTIVQSVTDEIHAARPTTPAAGSSPTIHTGQQS